MFKIRFYRGMDINDLTKKGKIKGIDIKYSTHCSFYECDCRSKCKYRKASSIHRILVNFRIWLSNNININKLPNILFIDKPFRDLSGTTRCPFNVPRRYHCNDCIYSDYDDMCEGICTCDERIKLIKARKFEEIRSSDKYTPCKFFTKNEFADNYDKETGKR